MKNFSWQSGNGINYESHNRLRKHFMQPKEPMGEAWFMGEERYLYNELQGDLANLSAYDLQEPLREIASGTSSFGPMVEWHSWYHYLLVELLPRSHESFVYSLLESLITGFMALYPDGVNTLPYKGFLDDVLLTLGSSIMDSRCWDESNIILGEILHRSNNNPNQVWCWWDASGDFSASMFFCVKYLPYDNIEEWFRSVLAIQSPHWQAQVLVWLVGSNAILSDSTQWPSEFLVESRPSIDWDGSHCLNPSLISEEVTTAPFLPEASCNLILKLVQSYFNEDVYLEWLSSISSVSYLYAELAEIPSVFEKLYVNVRNQ